jgi:hypothetical protein
MDVIGSVSCPTVGFGISGAEPLGSAAVVIICLFVCLSDNLHTQPERY